MRIVFMGPPGAGKGTQAEKLTTALEIPHISTGDMLRSAVREGTELGKSVGTYLDAGKLAPDDLMNAVVADRLARKDCEAGFLLDGFPRTLPQARALDRILAKMNAPLTGVVALEADPEVLVARLVKRGQEQGRSDDTESVIRDRLKVYARDTSPLIDYYAERGLLRRVDGIGTIVEVFLRVAAACIPR